MISNVSTSAVWATPVLQSSQNSNTQTFNPASTQTVDSFQSMPIFSQPSSFKSKIDQNYQGLMSGAENLIQNKLSLASYLGSQVKNPGAQIKMLLSAFSDSEWYINSILSDFQGLEVPPEARSLIAKMRSIQSTITTQINQTTGLNLSEPEMRALLENSPDNIKTNLPTNACIKQFDAALIQQNPAKDPINKDGTAHQTNDNAFGLQNNPAQKQALLGSANQKVTKELNGILQQARQMLAQCDADPKQAPQLLRNLWNLLQRGQQISAVGQALKDFNPGSQSQATSNFSQLDTQLTELTDKARQKLLTAGVPISEDSGMETVAEALK